MQGDGGKPLLILDHVGKGRVGLLLSDQIWLWARDHDGGGPQAELLRRLAHWLMKEPALDENRLTARWQSGMLDIDRRQLLPGPPPVVSVTDPDGTTRQVPMEPDGPGHATLALPAAAPGLWRVSDGVRTAYAASDMADPPEWADLRATATKAGRADRGDRAAAPIGCCAAARPLCASVAAAMSAAAVTGSACGATTPMSPPASRSHRCCRAGRPCRCCWRARWSLGGAKAADCASAGR